MKMNVTVPPNHVEALEVYRFGVTDRLYRTAHRTSDTAARSELLAQKAMIEQLDIEQVASMYLNEQLQQVYERELYDGVRIYGTETAINVTVSEPGKDDVRLGFTSVESFIDHMSFVVNENDATEAARDTVAQIERDALKIGLEQVTSSYQFVAGTKQYDVTFEVL